MRGAEPGLTGPRPGNARTQTCSKHVIGVLALLLLGVVGGIYLNRAVGDFGYQIDWQGSPRRQVTVDTCQAHSTGRSLTYTCVGHGARGSADAVGSQWFLPHAERGYRRGTLLQVRCTPTGGCVEVGLGEAFGDGAEFLFGLWFASIPAGTGLTLLGLRRNERARRTGLTLPFRLLIGWFTALPVLALLLVIASAVF